MPEVMEGSVLLGVGGAWPSSALVDDDGEPEKKKKQPSSADTSRLLGSASARAEDQAAVVRSLSFSKLLSFRIARAPSSLSSSLDINIAAAEDADAPASNYADESSSSSAKKKMTTTKQLAASHRMVCRSQSLPMSTRARGGSKRVADSSSLNQNGRKLFRVSVIAGPACDTEAKQQQQEEKEKEKEEEHEDVAEEDDLVCRICMVALSEGGNGTLKLECRCKGELALAHGDCAVRWFSIKGNANCDVCNHEVLNLPVTLRRLHQHQQQHQLIQQDQLDEEDAAAAAAAGMRNGNLMNLRGSSFRVWRGTPILAVVSMLAYFCFLEQLLVGDHGTAALAISLPFACVLGLFSSLTTTKMVSRRYVWIYSAVQYLFIVLFTHLFYRYVRMQAVISIILSTFAGFGVAICANAVVLQIMTWRARRASMAAQQQEIMEAQAQAPAPAPAPASRASTPDQEPTPLDLESATQPPP